MDIATTIRQKALGLGFDLVGITDAAPVDERWKETFCQWLDAGCAGRMRYMHRNIDKRFDPAELMPGAKSVIVTGLNYKPPEKETPPPLNEPFGTIAHYARYEDYHFFVKALLRRLAEFIMAEQNQLKFKICVDSVPLAERALAVRAGLGFIGKNQMLINPDFGPEIFLGELITDIELKTDEPVEDNCRDCDRCIRACPTGALQSDGRFDARKCISYLTIEYKGQIDSDLSAKMENRLFGCDECVLACPCQQQAPTRTNNNLKYYPQRSFLELKQVLNMSGRDFEEQFGDSPIYRPGLDILKRNARVCLENSRRR